jgi:1,4-alpha-glucan branching enzyme
MPRSEPVKAAAPAVSTISRVSEMGLDSLDQSPFTFPIATAPVAPPVAPKTTAQKIDEFYGVRQVGDQVVFAARFTGAKKVLIAGDFNNWSPMSTPMSTNGKPGVWVTRLPLFPGRYRYRFVVDGKWMTDPHNTYVETNQFGELNNVIEVD